MGYYINPTDGRTKEQWLEAHGEDPSLVAPAVHFKDGKVAVCLVDNGLFTAAGIAYDHRELEAFARPDHRPKLWFMVPMDVLAPFIPAERIDRQ